MSIGDTVRTTSPTAVRATAGGSALGGQPSGATGTVIGGPATAWTYTWWQVDYATGVDGWSTEQNLVLVPTTTVPGQVTGLTLAVRTVPVLSWDANIEPDLAGYKVYVSLQAGVYGAAYGLTAATTFPVTALMTGQRYYFTVTAYDQQGNESPKSNEVTYLVP